MKTSQNISITMPPEMLKKAEEAAREEGSTMSEFLRDALRRQLENREWQMRWQQIRAYGSKKAKEMGLKPSDVNRLIAEYRTEQGKK